MALNQDNTLPHHVTMAWLFGVMPLLAVAIFFLDLRVEAGIATGVLYACVICISSFAPNRKWIWGIAAVCVALTLTGYALSPEGSETQKVVLNRLLSIAAIMATALFVDLAKRHVQSQSVHRKFLERLVKDRTSQLSKTEERLRLIFEASPVALILTNKKGEMTMLNSETGRMFGYDCDELLGQTIEILVPEKYREEHPSHRNEYLSNPKKMKMRPGRELFGRRKDGSEVSVDIGLSPVETGHESLVLSAITDVSDRKTSETALREMNASLRRREDELDRTNADLTRSNRELEQFAYVASHDLQEPLRKISSYVELLREDCGERLSDDSKRYLDVVSDGADRLKNMVRDLLTFSRVTTHGNVLTPTDANACLQTAVNRLETAIRECDADITGDSLPTVMADSGQLSLLFQNLVGNAIKYRHEACPEIHIGSKDLGDQFEFYVKDNGIGIEPQYYDRIFEIFKRLHGRKKFSGTGIGLAVCKRIVDRMNGRIWVDSIPGSGSTFSFTLNKPLNKD